MRLLEANRLADIQYCEPYAGGAAIALSLLFEEYASVVHINDLSRAVFAFWHTALNNTADICRRIERAAVTMSEWRRQRAVYDAQESADLADLGFAALFLNRTNRSGILGGGPIGGKRQNGKWGVAARFNKADLVQRISKIGRYRTRIKLYRMDALEFSRRVIEPLGPRAFAFFDPPYIENGEGLYLNTYSLADHVQLASRIAALTQPWVATYDHAAIRADLFRAQRRMVYGLSYSAQNRRMGKEVMFFSDRLTLPVGWSFGKRICLAPARSEYPLYGAIRPAKRADVRQVLA
jgi:DNA adenine methylase